TSVQSAKDVSLRQTMPKANDDPSIAAWITQLGGKNDFRQGHLREIDLSRTPISDAQIAWLEPLTSVEKLSLATTEIGDVGAQSLAKLTELRDLNLSNTMVTDKT